MNLFAVSGIVIGISSFGEALWMFIKGKNKLHYLWGVFGISVMLWGFGSYKIATAIDPETAALWWHISYSGVIFIPIFFTHFVHEFLNISKSQLIKIIYFLGFFFLVFNATGGLFIDKVRWVFNQFYYLSSPPLFYNFFVIFFFGLVIYSHIKIAQAYKTAGGILKTQIKYIFIAVSIGFTGGGLAFLPVYKVDLYPAFNITISLSALIVAYAILRYRLMDIRLVLGKGAVYFLSFAMVITFAFFSMFLNNQIYQPLSFNIVGPLIIILSIVFFQIVFHFFEKLASKYFYYTFYSSQTVIIDLGKKLAQVLNLEKLSSLITSTLIDTLKLDRAAILLRKSGTDNYQIQKNIGFKKENKMSLVKDNFLTLYLKKTKKPLIFEEIPLIVRETAGSEERKRLEELKANMKEIEAALCLPLLIEERIIGIIVLGNKISRNPYSQQDIELLTTLSSQASIAFQNARLYDQVEDLSKNLEKKVQEQTAELQKAYEDLKVLDKAKSEFISMASHQLRTPLSAIKGYISMLVDGSYGKIPEKAKEKMENVFQSNERLIKIINDLLDVSKIEMGKMELDKEPISIEEMVQSCYEELKIGAENKGLKFIFKKSEQALPELEIDALKIRQVILNLIDNAIRYTQKGEIELKVGKVSSFIRISVRDTGAGMSPQEQRDVFEGFTRGSAGIANFIEGAGLGLYVAKKFLELHQGRIWVESEGEGKGSTFFVELPIK